MRRLLTITALMFVFFATSAQIPAGYYDAANGKTGAELKTALFGIIKDPNVTSYTGLWTSFKTTDKDTYYENDGTVLDIYSENPIGTDPYNFTFTSDQCGSYSNEGDCYNREHSFPQSWFNEASPMVSDLFHLYPTDGKVNGFRSNYPFGQVNNPSRVTENGSKLGPCSYPGYTGTVFEPIDEFKGDMARTYFYMVTCYENRISSWTSPILSGNTYPGYVSWFMNMLLEWNTFDPVSQKEIDRNNAVQDIQGNRNPYIDHPEWVCEVFGGNCGTNVEPANNLNAIGVSTTQIDLSWNLNSSNNNIVLAFNTTNNFGTPEGTYIPGQTISGGGTVLATGNAVNYSHAGLASQIYYYKVWSFDGIEYSSGISVSASPLMPEPSAHASNFTALNISSSTLDISWTDATGAVLPAGYIVKANYAGFAIEAPIDGQPESDGIFTKNVSYGDQIVTFDNLSPTTQYDFVIYPYTNSSINIDYKTDGVIPQTNATTTSVPEYCGNETFALMSVGSSSYTTVSWPGQDGSTWTATDSRTDQSINGASVCVRNGYIESGALDNGISEITVSTKRVFTGGTGVLALYVNGNHAGDIPYSDAIQTTTITGIDVSGEIVLKFETPGVGDRIVVDDIVWKCFGSGTAVDYDSYAQAPDVQIPENTQLFSETNYIDVFKFKATDKGTSDGLSTFVSSIKIYPKLPENTADWTNTISSVKVSDGTSDVTLSTVSITDAFINIPFSTSYEIADNSSIEISVSILLNNAQILDDCTLSFMIDADNHGFTAQESGSIFATVFASDIISNMLYISVPCYAPQNHASNILFTETNLNSSSLNWTQGDGQNRIVIAKEGSAVDAIPADGNSYVADSNFGSGFELSSGNFVVYNGNSNSTTVTGLSENTVYYFKIFEYNCETGNEKYYVEGTAAENFVSTLASDIKNLNTPVLIHPNPASEVVNISFTEIYDKVTVNIYDYCGRLMLKKTLEGSTGRINVSSLAKGMYFVEILIDENILRQKLIVE